MMWKLVALEYYSQHAHLVCSLHMKWLSDLLLNPCVPGANSFADETLGKDLTMKRVGVYQVRNCALPLCILF